MPSKSFHGTHDHKESRMAWIPGLSVTQGNCIVTLSALGSVWFLLIDDKSDHFSSRHFFPNLLKWSWCPSTHGVTLFFMQRFHRKTWIIFLCRLLGWQGVQDDGSLWWALKMEMWSLTPGVHSLVWFPLPEWEQDFWLISPWLNAIRLTKYMWLHVCDYMIMFHKIVVHVLLESLLSLLALRKQVPMLGNPTWLGTVGDLRKRGQPPAESQ